MAVAKGLVGAESRETVTFPAFRVRLAGEARVTSSLKVTTPVKMLAPPEEKLPEIDTFPSESTLNFSVPSTATPKIV